MIFDNRFNIFIVLQHSYRSNVQKAKNQVNEFRPSDHIIVTSRIYSGNCGPEIFTNDFQKNVLMNP